MTWTSHQSTTIANAVDDRSQMVVNDAGTKMYFIAEKKVFNYDGSTFTDITGTAFSSLNGGSGGTPCGIAWHDGYLYCLIGGAGTSDTGLYRYSGSGTTWTFTSQQHLDDADTWPLGYAAYNENWLSPVASDGTNFVVVAGNESFTVRLWSSTNPAIASRVDLDGDYDAPRSTLIGKWQGVPKVYGQDFDANKCIEVTGVATSKTSGTVTDLLIFAVDDNLQFFVMASGSDWQLGYSSNWGDTITACGAPYRTSGFPRYWRMFYDGTDVWLCGIFTDSKDRIYKWNDSTKSWDVDAEDSGHGGVIDHTPYGFFILNNHIYCLAASSTTVEVYDGGLVGATPLEFWKGQNGTGSKKSDMSVTGMTPDNLVVLPDGTVYAASNQAGDAVKVEQAGSGDDYAAWTDKTGSLDSGLGIKSLKRVNL